MQIDEWCGIKHTTHLCLTVEAIVNTFLMMSDEACDVVHAGCKRAASRGQQAITCKVP